MKIGCYGTAVQSHIINILLHWVGQYGEIFSSQVMYCHSLRSGQYCHPRTDPAKMNMQDCARILHARLAWHVHRTCPFSCTILAQSCTYLARNGARFCKRCCKNNYLQVCTFFCKILQELVQDCARIVEERRARAKHASLACKILAQSCTILQARNIISILSIFHCSITIDKRVNGIGNAHSNN